MKTRVEIAKFINDQFSHYQRSCKREKGPQHHYGRQELRELLDFIYEGVPKNKEEEINLRRTKR